MKVIQRRSQLIGVCVLLSCAAESLTAQRPMPVAVQRPSLGPVTTFAASLARETVVGDSGGVERAQHAVIGATIGAVVGAAVGYHRGKAAERACSSECGGPAGIGVVPETFYFGFIGLALGAIVGYVVP